MSHPFLPLETSETVALPLMRLRYFERDVQECSYIKAYL